MKAPKDGEASLDVMVTFEDERTVDAQAGAYRARGGPVHDVEPPPAFETVMANALVPFAQGLGRHTAWMRIRASPSLGGPLWHVAVAATLHPKKAEEPEPFTTAADYRLLHEQIQRRFREELRDMGTMAATFTAEQVALWFVGGWCSRAIAPGRGRHRPRGEE